MVHRRHAQTPLRLVHRRRRQALCALDHRRRVVCGKLVLSDAARHHADPDVAGAAGPRLFLRDGLHGHLGARRLLGYFIGALLYDSVGLWLIHLYGYGDKVEAFREAYARWGAWIILLKGLTPIPYKIVTITSGFAGYNIVLFTLCSIVARGGRFFVAALLMNRYGDWIRVRVERHLALFAAILLAVLVLGFVIAFKMI